MNIKEYGKQYLWQGMANDANENGSSIVISDGDNNLVSVPMPNPIQSSIVGGKIVFSAIPTTLVLISGTPTVASLIVGASTVLDLVVGVDLILNKPSVQAGGYLEIESLSITI